MNTLTNSSNRDTKGLGITVSYWKSSDAMKEWKMQIYSDYHVYIAKRLNVSIVENTNKESCLLFVNLDWNVGIISVKEVEKCSILFWKKS